MPTMTRATRGIRIACAGFVLLTTAAGCAQNAQQVPASAAAPTGAVSPIAAAANIAGAAVNTATGAVNGALSGAVNGANGTTAAQRKGPQVKPDGRGGYDASEVQADAIRRAHMMTARYGTTGYSKVTGRPTPTTKPAAN